METRIWVLSVLALMFAAGTALADGQQFKKGVGAFGKGGPRNTAPPISPVSDEKAPTTQNVDKYVCPMKCSESDKPGKCPKCGMKLEKQQARKAMPEHWRGKH